MEFTGRLVIKSFSLSAEFTHLLHAFPSCHIGLQNCVQFGLNVLNIIVVLNCKLIENQLPLQDFKAYKIIRPLGRRILLKSIKLELKDTYLIAFVSERVCIYIYIVLEVLKRKVMEV
jgi:hypothetical protein